MNKVALFAIIGTAMFLLSGATAFAATPSSATVHIQPNPTMNTNVTWSTFYHGWNPLEYNNGTANVSLNAEPSNTYVNYISVNPADIQANGTLTYNGIGVNKTAWETYMTSPYTTTPQTITQSKGVLKDAFNTSATTSEAAGMFGVIPITYYPSNNIEYDYLTMIVGLSGSDVAGVSAHIAFENGTGNQQTTSTTILPGQIQYVSYSLMQLNEMHKASFNTTGNGYSSSITPVLEVSLPESATTYDYTLTIYGMAMTTERLTLGTQTTSGTITTPDNFTGTGMQLSAFNPNFAWSSIQNNGYTVAVSQPLQNLTTQQNAISSGNYIEQVEYQGNFALPTAPDLTYGPTNLTEAFNISTAQTQVLDINGVSYLSAISGKNGTVQLLTSVNPNSQTQFLQIVDYTQSQWNSISVSPGIFTIAGIEYYWWIAVGGLATLIGLAAAAKHAGTKADQERIRRGR